jgi:protein TonB
MRALSTNPIIASPILFALCLTLPGCGGGSNAAASTVPAPSVAAPATPAPAAAPVDPKTSAAELLARGNAAFRAGRIVAPAGDNALEFFLGARERNPDSPGAKEAIVDLIPATRAAVEARIGSDEVAEAQRILDLFERATPGSMTVNSLRARLAARQAQLASANDAAAARARATPTSADAHLAAATPAATAVARPPAPPAVSAATPAPTPAMAAPETAPALTDKIPDAVAMKPAAEEPAPARMAPAAPVAADFVAPTVATRSPPEYPQQARQRRQEGWVELEFTVSVEGRVSDVAVLDAQPKGVFEGAAQRTIGRWRYTPAQRDGQPQAARARARITFKLS